MPVFSPDGIEILKETVNGLAIGLKQSTSHLIHNYVYVPIGTLIFLCALYGINRGLSVKTTLPSSVVVLLVLFLGLLGAERVFGSRRVTKALHYINIPCGFSLQWINIFFTPSIILLPLATPVSVAEAFEIAGVFVIGYLVLFVGLVFFVRGLNAILGSQTKAHENAESAESQELQELERMTHTSERSSADITNAVTNNVLNTANTSDSESNTTYRNDEEETIPFQRNESSDMLLDMPQRAANISRPHNPGVDLPEDVNALEDVYSHVSYHRSELPAGSDLSARIANCVVQYIDWFLYGLLLVAGIPVYYTVGASIFMDVGGVALVYRLSLLVPPKWKKIFHPILVCGGAFILVIYIFAVIRRQSLHDALEAFKTGRNYLKLFDSEYKSVWPGAGDVLSTLLDVSIVSLAVPMYNYRVDLIRHFFIIVIPCVISGVLCLFAYPAVSKAVGISAARALAMVSRSVTLALAIPITDALGGSVTCVSVVAILSGIVGVLVGDLLLTKVLRVPKGDYVVRGLTLGISSSAVASAHLLSIDPRAAALSSLSFFVYGVSMIILTAIPPIANVVTKMVE